MCSASDNLHLLYALPAYPLYNICRYIHWNTVGAFTGSICVCHMLYNTCLLYYMSICVCYTPRQWCCWVNNSHQLCIKCPSISSQSQWCQPNKLIFWHPIANLTILWMYFCWWAGWLGLAYMAVIEITRYKRSQDTQTVNHIDMWYCSDLPMYTIMPQSAWLCVYLCIPMSVCLSVYQSACPPVRLPACLFVCFNMFPVYFRSLSVCICDSVGLYICW